MESLTAWGGQAKGGKLHLAADSAMHEIICADLSLSATTGAQALPGQINQTYHKIRKASAAGAYDTRY